MRSERRTGAATIAPTAARRPSRAFARIRPSPRPAYAIVSPFFVIACTFDSTSMPSAAGNSSSVPNRGAA